MKHLLFIFLLASSHTVQSQNIYEIELSKTLNETRMGVWIKGDYKIYIELTLLETGLRNTGQGFLNEGLTYNPQDSIRMIYMLTSKRYLAAADQLKKAKNGFDLRKLVVYYGPENEKENSGNSFLIEETVKQFLENGMAAVYYKGERVFTLKKLDESHGESLDFGYNIVIYYDDVENYVFEYYVHLGW